MTCFPGKIAILIHVLPQSFRPGWSRAAACLLVPFVAGCVTGAESDPAEKEVLDVASDWIWSLAREDFDAALALVSEDFSSDRWPQRADLAYYFQQAQDRHYFAEAVVANERPDVMLDGGEAVVYPVGLRARLGTAVYLLTMRQSESGWEIVSARLELY